MPHEKKFQNPTSLLALSIGACTAIGIQILAMKPVGTTIIRFAISDLIVPIGVLAFLITFIAVERRKPKFHIPKIDIILFGFFLLLGVSSMIGLYRTDTFITWAWGAKFLGFGVLLAYFFIGVLVSECGSTVRRYVVLVFLATSWMLALSALLRFFVELNGLLPFGYMAYRPVGLSNNPNAFSFLLATSIFLQIFMFKNEPVAVRRAGVIGLAAMAGTIFLIASRSVYLGMIFSLPVLIFFWRLMDWKMLYWSAIFAPLLVFLSTRNFDLFVNLTTTADQAAVAARDTLSTQALAYATRNGIVVDGGVAARLETMWLALDLWQTSPVFGIGLGGFMHHYANVNDGIIFALHTSGLWLLVETGLIGLIYFAAIFCAFTWSNLRRSHTTHDHLYVAISAILLFSLGASIGTEIIYQRQIWFLLGLTATMPAIRSKV